MTHKEINQIFANLTKACKAAAVSINRLAERLNEQHLKRNKANHNRKSSRII